MEWLISYGIIFCLFIIFKWYILKKLKEEAKILEYKIKNT